MTVTPNHPWKEPLDEWLFDARQGSLSPANREALNVLLLTNSAARRHARQIMMNDVALQDVLQLKTAETLFAREGSIFPQSNRREEFGSQAGTRFWPLAAALMALLGVLSFWASRHSDSPLIRGEPTNSGVAVLSRSFGAQWNSTSNHPCQGQVLEQGELRLVSGLVQIDFFNGAQVVLEGPVVFKLVSANEGFCETGKVRVEIPSQAQGFKITAPNLTVQNNGTAFGISVSSEGVSELSVFKGRLEVLTAGGTNRDTLAEGDAVRVDKATKPVVITPQPSQFATASSLQAQMVQSAEQRYAHWKSALTAPPPADLLVHYTFERNGEDLLQNHGSLKTPEADGFIIGSQWAEGRWSQKAALDFKRSWDRIRINVPGRYNGLTWMAWVRVDALPNSYNGLLLAMEGRMHWQLTQAGHLQIGADSVHGRQSAKSPVLVTSNQFGQWIQLCSSIDGIEGKICHYLNGQKVSEDSISKGISFEVGAAEIGNNTKIRQSAGPNPIRNFNGRMDELLLFSRALAPEEVRRLFDWGDPNRLAPMSISVR
jgi:hypothetical protein